MENTNHQTLQHRVAEIQLVYRSNVKPSQRPKVSSSREAYEVFFKNWDLDKIEFVEQFKVMLLNRAHKASSVIVAHNHPSGCLTPSQADINLTKKLKDGGKLLDIAVLDHVIVTNEGHYSFADEGML